MDSNPKNESAESPEPLGEAALEQAETLIWAMLDDAIEPTDVKVLEGLLEESQPVRELYIQCVHIHCDLQQLFGDDPKAAPELPKSPILGSLGDLRPGTDTLPLRE